METGTPNKRVTGVTKILANTINPGTSLIELFSTIIKQKPTIGIPTITVRIKALIFLLNTPITPQGYLSYKYVSLFNNQDIDSTIPQYLDTLLVSHQKFAVYSHLIQHVRSILMEYDLFLDKLLKYYRL